MPTACFPHNQVDSWQQLNNHTLLATHSLLSGHEKTRETRNNFKKLASLKKGIGVESEKTIYRGVGSNLNV